MNELQEAAQQVLGAIEGQAPQPGGFVTSLVETFTKADKTNRDRLAFGYPALGVMIWLWKDVLQGDRIVRDIAAGQFPDLDFDDFGCEGHESLRGDSMGVTVECDGTCRLPNIIRKRVAS